MTIKQWQVEINEWAKGKGWNEDLDGSVDSIGKQVTSMHSELSEAWEEIKDGHKVTEVYYPTSKFGVAAERVENRTIRVYATHKPEGFPIKLADCVIQILHTCEFYGIDLEEMIRVKMEYNKTRSYRHGGKRA